MIICVNIYVLNDFSAVVALNTRAYTHMHIQIGKLYIVYRLSSLTLLSTYVAIYMNTHLVCVYIFAGVYADIWALLQQKVIILRSLLIEATPYGEIEALFTAAIRPVNESCHI